MFDWNMSDEALNSYEQDAQEIHTPARILRLIKQVRDHRKEIERQRALIKDAEYIFILQLGYFNNENENHKDRDYIDYLLGLGRYFNSNE